MVSIIMPTYNRAYIIQQAIDSVLGQTYQDWELIIVDDGSTDETEGVVKKNADVRIRYIRYEQNKGANHARNVGLKAAKGDYLTFLDSDAVYVPDKLQKQVNAIQGTTNDIIWGQAKFILSDGKEGISTYRDEETLNNEQMLIPLGLREGLINTSTLLLRRSCYELCGGFDESLKRFQDWDFWLRLLLAKQFKARFINEIFVVNYMQKDSISSDDTTFVKAHCAIVKKHIEAFRQYDSIGSFWNRMIQYWNNEQPPSDYEELQQCLRLFTQEELLSVIYDSFSYIGKQKKQIEQLVTSIEKHKLEKQKMEWRFPRERIPKKSRIIVYGAGNVGKSIVMQMEQTNYCHVVLWVDKNYKNMEDAIHNPEEIIGHTFNFVVVAIFDKKTALEIADYLHSLGITHDKIVMI